LRADHINREALVGSELHIGELESHDAEILKALLEAHQGETGSRVAARILENFDAELKHFTRVLPSDYAAVLKIREQASAEGIDPDSDVVWKQILEVTNG
jgi:glutamate synthase (NADPH/NADH) large chain